MRALKFLGKTLGKSQLINPWVTDPWTHGFQHLTSHNRQWERRSSFRDPILKTVRIQDRIKYWNIVPGDHVRVRGNPDQTLYEVHCINRLNNMIIVYAPLHSQNRQTLKFHYSQLQLLVGHRSLPTNDGSAPSKPVPFFATRLSTTKPTWNHILHRWDWQRFAVNTTPRLPTWIGDIRDRIKIPWPVPEPRPRSEPTLYDTPEEVVTKITYRPPAFPANTDLPLPEPPSKHEHEYIKYLHAPEMSVFEDSHPMECNLVREVSDPHSRAKRQKRWKMQQEYRHNLLKQFTKAELKNLKGRNRQEARAEATFKWKQKLEEERKAEIKRRRSVRGQEAKGQRKVVRATRKQEKMKQKLTNLVLEQGNNQVLRSEYEA